MLGVYVQADADFTAQLVYTAPDGSCLTKTLQVTIDRNATAEYPFPDSEITTFAERPTPAVTSGKITKVAKVNGTWLIWFNGEPAYCCTHGANGQPAGCPTYTYVNTSTVNADQCIPGDHYGNQIRIWGGLNQLSLGDADDLPAAFSADEGEEISLLDFCASIYDDVQMYIIENFPESTTAEIYLASADELLNGVETYASARGYYTYIYNPGRAGWQTVALIGPEIGEEEPEPEPVVQEYYASWEAPAQTASGSFDFSYGIRTDKIQLKTQEKVDGATIEIEPITKSGSIDGGSWSISPAGKQTVTTSGHTADDNYQKNGGDASASWSLHYAVTKTSGTRNGQVGPFTTQEAADAAANSARDAAMQQEYQAENQPVQQSWQKEPELPVVRRVRCRSRLNRPYKKVGGIMACYYHYCALLRRNYRGRSGRRCYYLLREDFSKFNRYRRQCDLLWEQKIESTEELRTYKARLTHELEVLTQKRKYLYNHKEVLTPDVRNRRLEELSARMRTVRRELNTCTDIETDAAALLLKWQEVRQAEKEEREVNENEQRRRSR